MEQSNIEVRDPAPNLARVVSGVWSHLYHCTDFSIKHDDEANESTSVTVKSIPELVHLDSRPSGIFSDEKKFLAPFSCNPTTFVKPSCLVCYEDCATFDVTDKSTDAPSLLRITSTSKLARKNFQGVGNCSYDGASNAATSHRSVKSLGSIKTDGSKQTSAVSFSPSVDLDDKFETQSMEPKPSVAEIGMPTKLHNLIIECSSSTVRLSKSRWKAIFNRLSSHPEETEAFDNNLRTPLTLACEWGNEIPVHLIEEILDCNPDAAATPDKFGSYPIHYYVSSNRGGKWCRQTEALDLLLDYYPEATLKTNKFGQTPLMAALESSPADIKAKDKESHPKLRTALIQMLYDANPLAASIPDRNYSFPLHYASKGPNVVILKKLMAQCPSVIAVQDSYGVTPLLLAVGWEVNTDTIKELLKAYPKAALLNDNNGECPLTYLWNSLVHGKKRDKSERAKVKENRRIINCATSVDALGPTVGKKWDQIQLLLRAAHSNTTSKDLPPNRQKRILHAVCGVAVSPELVRFTMQVYPGQVNEVGEFFAGF